MLAVFPWLLTVVVVASATKHPGMALNTSNNTEYWRKRAKETRAVALHAVLRRTSNDDYC